MCPSFSHSGHETGHAANTPTGVLREEHEIILRALAVLERVGREMAQGKAVPPETIAWLADFFRTFSDRCHHAKEETHLFPALEQHGIPNQGGPIGVMLMEHEEGRALVRTFAEAEPAIAVAAIRRYVQLLREHIDKENDVLFPMSDQILPPQEQAAMMRAFEASELEIAGPDVHRRYLAGLEQLEAAFAK